MKKLAMIGLIGLIAVGTANAAEVFVTDDIATSTTWTADNTYNLQNQINVLPGASLTIEAGTVVASTPTANGSGSLAVTRGGMIFVNGTANNPVIMTSTNDVATWTGGDPKTGTWREAANEWGNLTIMGDALISASHYKGEVVGTNTKEPTGLNEKQMEGLTAEGCTPGDDDCTIYDAKVMYGGADDNDDSGSIHYLSIRYGGRVLGLANELNGLSLGAIGRATDIDHVEIMNNVDDGIEIWGGTVNLKYVSIWNIGDDSFDIDEGWRGKAQFGLIVQGYSVDASQGSGVGDNCIEMDGAEDSDAQPVTTGVIYNFTVVGQYKHGDGGATYRDNCRMQIRNSIFMNIGEEIVRWDDTDGDGGNRYGYNGTLSWADTWTTDYSVTSPINAGTWTPGAFNDPAVMYTAQVDGKLLEISDTVFWGNDDATGGPRSNDGDDQAVAVGVFNAANNNVEAPFTSMPIQALTRGAKVVKGGKDMYPVTMINPCAANDALTSVATAPADGFFTPAPFRGAFSANNNWLAGWTAADAFGMTDTSMNTADPAAAIAMAAAVTFDSVAGVIYTIEESTDMVNWAPITTVVGDGSTMTILDEVFDASKFYRVINQ